MSSEMRELIAKWRRIGYAKHEKARGPFVSESDKIANLAEGDLCHQFADELEALLARTEAGADGDGFLGFVHECVWEDGTSRTIYEKQPSLLRERPGLTSQRVVRAYTHPQDASGDAVMTGPGDHDDLPAFLEWVASEVVRRDTRAGNFAEGLAQSLRGRAHILRIVKNDAMQAKEAK